MLWLLAHPSLLRPEFPKVNHKRMPLPLALNINEVWSMDFVSDSLVDGRRIKCLTVADDYGHECVDIATDYGIGGQYAPIAESSGLVSQASWHRADRQRARLNEPRFHRTDADPWDSPHPGQIGPPDAKQLHRELQRQVSGRIPERAVI